MQSSNDDISRMTSSIESAKAKVGALGLAAMLSFGLGIVAPEASMAISGGGLDYAESKISRQDFSNGKYQAKDFSGAIAKGTLFKNSDLRGARFFKADLTDADFTGANLAAASLEGANLEGAIMTKANLSGSYFSQTLTSVGDISGADFTEASMRSDVQKALCQRADAKGTNPLTGNDTYESLMCDML